MKKNLIWLAGIAMMLAACESSTEYDNGYNQEQGQKAIVFNCEGDLTFSAFDEGVTRSGRRTMEADGKAMTDLWVLDYVGGQLVQQVHQASTDEDFGTPTLNLDGAAGASGFDGRGLRHTDAEPGLRKSPCVFCGQPWRGCYALDRWA